MSELQDNVSVLYVAGNRPYYLNAEVLYSPDELSALGIPREDSRYLD